jgi:hypothetical protein
VGAEPVGEFLDRGDPVVAAFGDDVGGPELQRQLLSRFVSAHRDDPLSAELRAAEDAHQADGAVDRRQPRSCRAGLGRDGGEPAGAEHFGGGEEVGHQVVVRHFGGGDQRAVGHGTRIRSA